MSKDIIMVLMLSIVIVMTAGTFWQAAQDRKRRAETAVKYGRRIERLKAENSRLQIALDAKTMDSEKKLAALEHENKLLAAQLACKDTLLEQRWKAATV